MFVLSIVVACVVALVLAFFWRLWWLIQREPHFKIGRDDGDDWYMLRWYVIPRNRFGFNIYLHKILRDDDPVALHDHPWSNWSWVMPHWLMRLLHLPVPAQGNGYVEVMPFYRRSSSTYPGSYQPPNLVRRTRGPGSFVARQATDAHRLEVLRNSRGETIPCWTIFVTGSYQRKWGFWLPSGWVAYDALVTNDGASSVWKKGNT